MSPCLSLCPLCHCYHTMRPPTMSVSVLLRPLCAWSYGPFVWFHVCSCPLCLCGISIISSGSQCHILSFCPSVSPCTSKSPVRLSTLSLALSVSLVSALYLQGPVTSPRVVRFCLGVGLSLSCDGVLFRALLTPGHLLVSTEHCVPESD